MLTLDLYLEHTDPCLSQDLCTCVSLYLHLPLLSLCTLHFLSEETSLTSTPNFPTFPDIIEPYSSQESPSITWNWSFYYLFSLLEWTFWKQTACLLCCWLYFWYRVHKKVLNKYLWEDEQRWGESGSKMSFRRTWRRQKFLQTEVFTPGLDLNLSLQELERQYRHPHESVFSSIHTSREKHALKVCSDQWSKSQHIHFATLLQF